MPGHLQEQRCGLWRRHLRTFPSSLSRAVVVGSRPVVATFAPSRRSSLIAIVALLLLSLPLALASHHLPSSSARSMRSLLYLRHQHHRPSSSTTFRSATFRRFSDGNPTGSPPLPTRSSIAAFSGGGIPTSSSSLRSQAVASARSPFLPSSLSTALRMEATRAMSSTSPADEAEMKRRTASTTERLAARLITGRYNDDDDDKSERASMRVVVAVAGGGAGAAAAMASVPGASSVLLESLLAYDRRSYAEFVSEHRFEDEEGWDGGGEDLWSFAGGDGKVGNDNYVGSGGNKDESFKFCSAEAAVLLSRAALRRSMELTPSFLDRSLSCVGVGSASCLVGQEPTPGRKSRAYVALSTMKEGTILWEVELSADDDEDSNIVARRRTRIQEDAFTSDLILLSMLRHREQSLSTLTPDASWNVGRAGTTHRSILCQILSRSGDELVERRLSGNGGGGATNTDDRSPSAAARRIVDGKANVAAIVPVLSHGSGDGGGRMEAISFDRGIPAPLAGGGEGGTDVLVVPGSFNPPHHGHAGLANAAVRAWQRKRRQKNNDNGGGDDEGRQRSILDKVWEASVDGPDEATPTVWFEMSVTNADKPPMDPVEAGRRVDLFMNLTTTGGIGNTTSPAPKDWAVVLTNAPLFLQKATALGEVLRSAKGGGGEVDLMPNITFVLGTDTMVRIIDPKYYGNSRENMIDALIEMKESGVNFIVGGRLEQGKEMGTKFVSGQEEIDTLPPPAKEMFTILEEKDFRMDVSSTDLRKKIDEASDEKS